MSFPLPRATASGQGGDRLDWLRFVVDCPPEAEEAVVGLLQEVTGSGPCVEDHAGVKRVSAYVPATSGAEALELPIRTRLQAVPAELSAGAPLSVSSELVHEEDWAQAWKAFYRPLRVGRRLVIKPSWLPWPPDEDPTAARADDLVIELDPGMAFGTGNHASTQLCLTALEDLVAPHMCVADLGCGSGILSIAAAKLGARRVVAADVDPVAVEVAAENVTRNGVATVVSVVAGDLAAMGDAPYDLLVANVNAPMVSSLAPQVHCRLRPGGLYVAAGIVDNGRPPVEAAIESAGFAIQGIRSQEGWVCLVARRLQVRQ